MPYMYTEALGALLSIVAVSRTPGPGRRFWLQADRLHNTIARWPFATRLISSIDYSYSRKQVDACSCRVVY